MVVGVLHADAGYDSLVFFRGIDEAELAAVRRPYLQHTQRHARRRARAGAGGSRSLLCSGVSPPVHSVVNSAVCRAVEGEPEGELG